MTRITESEVEDAALEWFAGLGYAVLHGADIGPEGPAPERGSYDEVMLTGRLREALARLNPNLPADTLEDVLGKVRQTETPSLVEENRRLHRYLRPPQPEPARRHAGGCAGQGAADGNPLTRRGEPPFAPLPAPASTRTCPPTRWRMCWARCGRRKPPHSSRRTAVCTAT